MEGTKMPEQKFIELTWEEWVEQYKPHTDEFGDPKMFDTHGEEGKSAASTPNELVWTYLEGDTGTLITEGYHYVNRLGYYITEVPSLPDTSYEIDYVADRDEDEDEDGEEDLT
jgi:hypothetical protein